MAKRKKIIKCKVLLSEFPSKSPPTINHMIEVPNFFRFCQNEKTEFKEISQPFKFISAIWQFQCHSDNDDVFCKTFYVSLTRLNSILAQHTIFSTIVLFDASGTREIERACETYDEHSTNNILCSFSHFSYSRRYDEQETLTLIIRLIYRESTDVYVARRLIPNTRMTGQTKDCKILLSLLPNSSAPLPFDCIMKVPNFFILPEYTKKFKICSRVFKFADASWRFIIESNGGLDDDDDVFFRKYDVSMMRVSSEKKKHLIFYHSALRKLHNLRISFSKSYMVYSNSYPILLSTIRVMMESSVSNDLTLDFHLICDESKEVYTFQELLTINREMEQLSQDFKKLFLDGVNHDLTLRVAEREFQVHRNILRIRSPVFESMFSHDTAEKSKGVIEISDCAPEAMEQFLIYLYSGKVDTLNEDNVIELYYIADKYNTEFLKKRCSEFLKKSICPSRICDMIQLAKNHCDSDLLKCATEYFLKNTKDIFRTPEWKSFLKSNEYTANELLLKASKKWKSNCDE